jgi:CheY-like chemotaxis protein
VTGHASVEDREHAVAVGFQLHVPKPIDPEELATVVASVASRAAGA